MKKYPDAEYFPLTTENLSDALQIAEKWFAEKFDGDISLKIELAEIKEAADNWENLGMKGGILYADGEPAAMVMFSLLNENCIDVHFEKSVDKFALNGAFVAINKFMASSAENLSCEYINREEDMGVPGLKKAKESWQPHFKLKKYYGEILNDF